MAHCWETRLNVQKFLAHGLRLSQPSQPCAFWFLYIRSRLSRKLHHQVMLSTEVKAIWAGCIWQADIYGLHRLRNLFPTDIPLNFETQEEETFMLCFCSAYPRAAVRQPDRCYHNKSNWSNTMQTLQDRLLVLSQANDLSRRMEKMNALEKSPWQNI